MLEDETRERKAIEYVNAISLKGSKLASPPSARKLMPELEVLINTTQQMVSEMVKHNKAVVETMCESFTKNQGLARQSSFGRNSYDRQWAGPPPPRNEYRSGGSQGLFCEIHRTNTHDTKDCRASCTFHQRVVCYACGQGGHTANRCTNRQPQYYPQQGQSRTASQPHRAAQQEN